MKKLISMILLTALVCGLSGCGSGNIEVDYGSSELYSREDMDAAVSVIMKEFRKWNGCVMCRLTYGSDGACGAETLAWMNQLEAANDAKEHFTQCIMFESVFHSPVKGGGAWEADEDYYWQWWLARSEGGAWKLMTWGY